MKEQHKGIIKVKMLKVISENASNRATSYEKSNKIITAKNKIFIVWLDNKQHCMIDTYDITSDQWSDHVGLGACVDNHGGAALAMDSKGYLYVVFGPHARSPFKLRKSLKPYDASKWAKVEIVPSGNATYPGIVFDDKDTMHLICRCHGADKITLKYMRLSKEGKWSEPCDLADAYPDVDASPYDPRAYRSHYSSLTVSKDGIIHLACHLYRGVNPYCHYVYMCSRDDGNTWENAKGEKLELPVTPESPCIIMSELTGDEMPGWKGGSTRIGNIALDDKGRPWIVYGKNLWYQDGDRIKAIDLSKYVEENFPGKELTIVGSITFDKEGMLYLVSHIRPRGMLGRAPELSEVILITSSDYGQNFRMSLVFHEDPKDPNVPNWCPNIERPFNQNPLESTPSFIYQAGDPGFGNPRGNYKGKCGFNDPNLRMKVVFVRLVKE